MGDDIVWSAWRHAADVWCLYAGDEMEEIWKPYIEGYYEASTLGNIRSVDREVLFNGTPGIRKGIILKPTKNSKGYLTIAICCLGIRATMSVHRIIAETFLANPEEKAHVNHKDGDPLNNKVDNLEWATPSENQKHAYVTGLRKNGEGHGNALLTEDQVREVRRYMTSGGTQRGCAEKFGVSRGCIQRILDGTSWSHVK